LALSETLSASQRRISGHHRRPISLAAGFPAAKPNSRHTGPVDIPLAPSRQHQIAEGEQGEQLRLVLGQPLVAHLPVGEEVLDHMKRMLHLGADAGLGLLDRQEERFLRRRMSP